MARSAVSNHRSRPAQQQRKRCQTSGHVHVSLPSSLQPSAAPHPQSESIGRPGRIPQRTPPPCTVRSASHAVDVDDQVDGQGDRFASAVVREPDVGRQNAVRQSRQRLLGGVRVDGAERALVAGVERLQQVERLCAAHFANQDPIGPVPQRRPQRSAIVTAGSGASWPNGRWWPARLEADQVGLLDQDLGRLLDQDDAVGGSIVAASALSSVVLPVPVPPDMRMFLPLALRRGRAEARQCHDAVPPPTSSVQRIVMRELPHRQRRAIDRAWREHGGHTRAILEPSRRAPAARPRSRRRTHGRCS